MPKLPSLTPQKIIKLLEKNGFVLDRIKGTMKTIGLIECYNEGQRWNTAESDRS